MRGLSDREVEILEEGTESCPDPDDDSAWRDATPVERAISSRLQRRGLIQSVTLSGLTHDTDVDLITPLGRLALSIHHAIRASLISA